MTMKGFGKRLKILLDKKGISQDQLAIKLGVSKGFVSLIINDKRDVSLQNLYKIAEILKCSPKDLV